MYTSGIYYSSDFSRGKRPVSSCLPITAMLCDVLIALLFWRFVFDLFS